MKKKTRKAILVKIEDIAITFLANDNLEECINHCEVVFQIKCLKLVIKK